MIKDVKNFPISQLFDIEAQEFRGQARPD